MNIEIFNIKIEIEILACIIYKLIGQYFYGWMDTNFILVINCLLYLKKTEFDTDEDGLKING